MITNEFRFLIEAYTQASSDGDIGTAEALLRELDGLVVSSQHDRVKAEKLRDGRWGNACGEATRKQHYPTADALF
jgi:hypothetical protein